MVSRIPSKSRRAQGDEEHEQRIDREIAVVDREQRRPSGLDRADDEPAEEGARKGADASDDSRRQRLEGQRRRKAVADCAIGRGHDRAGEAGERARKDEGARRGRGGADAEQLGGQRIVGVGAPFATHPGPAEDNDEAKPHSERDGAGDEGHRRRDGDEFAGPGERERLVQRGTHPACPIALGEAQEFLKKERQTDRRHQRLLAPGVTQRNEDGARRGKAPARRHDCSKHEGRAEQWDWAKARKRERRHRRSISARGGELAEGEIDAPDQPVNERIGCRQKRVDRRQRQPVERHLKDVSDARRNFRRAAQVSERGRDRRRALRGSPASNGLENRAPCPKAPLRRS